MAAYLLAESGVEPVLALLRVVLEGLRSIQKVQEFKASLSYKK
jgi:hypothetical protein